MNKLSNEVIDKISNALFLKYLETFHQDAKNYAENLDYSGRSTEEIVAFLATHLGYLSIKFAKDFSTELAKEIIQKFESNE